MSHFPERGVILTYSYTHLCSPTEMLPSNIFLTLVNNEDLSLGNTELIQKPA